ncbi:hypothetical protein [Brevundimonas sp. MYb52]|uniref:hypothetical protein n=1 Tax=Brevundimonas sp. MYb52 TaxID=1848622 RepID=UPI0011B03D07|nr:hypothetical protein [Brevundimonas sp. MYb52]
MIDPDHRQPRPVDLPAELHDFFDAAVHTFEAEPAGHVQDGNLPAVGFDPDAWIERLAIVGGGVWFSLALSMSPDGDVGAALPIWAEIREPIDAEARRAAIARAMILREARNILADRSGTEATNRVRQAEPEAGR